MVFSKITHFIIQHIVTLPKYGHGELNIGRKMAGRFQKVITAVITSQEHQTINNAVLY